VLLPHIKCQQHDSTTEIYVKVGNFFGLVYNRSITAVWAGSIAYLIKPILSGFVSNVNHCSPALCPHSLQWVGLAFGNLTAFTFYVTYLDPLFPCGLRKVEVSVPHLAHLTTLV
jgi:hypothetical protein